MTSNWGGLLLEQFGQRGWTARHLNHPRELEKALNETVPDLLVLDELLPAQRGTDVLARLRLNHPYLPVLMLSALGAPRDRVAGLEAGANDYLGKPFLFRELQLLCSRAGAVVSRQELGQASGSLVDVEQSRSIDVRLSRLRRLLEELQPEGTMIETVRGQGYRLVAPVQRLPLGRDAGGS